MLVLFEALFRAGANILLISAVVYSPLALGAAAAASPPLAAEGPRWSGLMRGAVSVALVYLNFDTVDGSMPRGEPIVAPHRRASASGGGGGDDRRHHHHHMLLLRRARSLLDGVADSAAAVPSSLDPDAVAAAASTAAALAEAGAESARQHATLIASTLLVVVASVLVVSTLTKPLLQVGCAAGLTDTLNSRAMFTTWRRTTVRGAKATAVLGLFAVPGRAEWELCSGVPFPPLPLSRRTTRRVFTPRLPVLTVRLFVTCSVSAADPLPAGVRARALRTQAVLEADPRKPPLTVRHLTRTVGPLGWAKAPDGLRVEG